MQADDATLVREAAGGDQAAYRALVDRHSRRLFRLAYRITGTREDAEDVVQEAFVRAFRQIHRFESRANFGTWLYRIAFNCAVDSTRSRPHHEAIAHLETVAAAAPGLTGSDLVYADQVRARVEHALTALSNQERAAFVMRHYQECSIEEIGRTLNLQTSAAKHAVFRAVRKMRAALRPLVTRQGEGTLT